MKAASCTILGTASQPLLFGSAKGQATTTAYFAGCFFDTALTDQSLLRRYLINPERKLLGLSADDPSGGELSNKAARVLEARKTSDSRIGSLIFNSTDPTATPIVLLVTRAQHETIVIRTPPIPDETLTIITLGVAADVLTDRAALRNTNRLEFLSSELLIVEQVIQRRSELSEAELIEKYRELFDEAVIESAGRALEKRSDSRLRSKAVFQVKGMALPSPLPPDLQALIFEDSNKQQTQRLTASEIFAYEQRALQRELEHFYTYSLHRALKQQGILDIALLPATSPWTEARLLPQLRQRLGLGSEIVFQSDSARFNSYEIRSGIINISRQTVSRQTLGNVVQISASTGARFVRRSDRDELIPVPISIVDPTKKVALGFGGRTYNDIAGFNRGASRDLIFGAIRDAFTMMAAESMPLLKLIRDEVL